MHVDAELGRPQLVRVGNEVGRADGLELTGIRIAPSDPGTAEAVVLRPEDVLAFAGAQEALFWLLQIGGWLIAIPIFVLVLLVAGLVWGLHPLRVESVAWVTERKDVLSMFFFLLCLCAYSGYVRARDVRRYLLALVFFPLV